MLTLKVAVVYLLRFGVIYSLFIVPWPGGAGAYARCFRGIGQFLFGTDEGPREVTFKPVAVPQVRAPITRIEIVNRELMNQDGSGPVRNFDVDQQSLGWAPVALFSALMLATPLPWKKRIAALAVGIILVQCYVFLVISVGIHNESAELLLVHFTPFWKQIAAHLQSGLVASDCTFVVPAIIWMLIMLSGWCGVAPLWGSPGNRG